MFGDWRKTTLLLALYGLFKEIRPIEPFLNEYLMRQVWYLFPSSQGGRFFPHKKGGEETMSHLHCPDLIYSSFEPPSSK